MLGSMSPTGASVRGGETVEIFGQGFDGRERVYFGEIAAVIVSATPSKLVVTVPRGRFAGSVAVRAVRGERYVVLDQAFHYGALEFRFLEVARDAPLVFKPAHGRMATMSDLDGDGDLDVAQATEDGLRIYHNNGAGYYAAAPAGTLPTGLPSEWVNQVVVADFTGDAVVDLFLVNHSSVANRILVNDGQGRFYGREFSVPTAANNSVNAAAFDVDLDGDLDLVVVNSAWTDSAGSAHGASVELLINDGRGTFVEESGYRLPDLVGDFYAVTAGDVDGDGYWDLFLSVNTGFNRLLINDANGNFSEAPPGSLPGRSDPLARLAAMGDLDGDGSLDIFVPSEGQDMVLINDGQGRFTDQTESLLGPESEGGYSVSLADLDNDRALDVVVSNPRGELRIYRNNGSGRLFDRSSSMAPLGPFDSTAISTAIGDVDNDGDPDVFVSRHELRRPWLLLGWDPAAGSDVDGDKIPDALDNCPDVANPYQRNADASPFACDGVEACEAKWGCELAARGTRAYLSCSLGATFDSTLTVALTWRRRFRSQINPLG